MMMPSIFGENLFDDFDSWFSDPVEKRFFGKKNPLYGKHAKNLMKTDVRETKNSYFQDLRKMRLSWNLTMDILPFLLQKV